MYRKINISSTSLFFSKELINSNKITGNYTNSFSLNKSCGISGKFMNSINNYFLIF